MYKVEFRTLMERYKFVLDTNKNRYKKYPLRYKETKTKIRIYLTDLDSKEIYCDIDKGSIEASGMTVEEWKTNTFQTSLGAYEVISKIK